MNRYRKFLFPVIVATGAAVVANIAPVHTSGKVAQPTPRREQPTVASSEQKPLMEKVQEQQPAPQPAQRKQEVAAVKRDKPVKPVSVQTGVASWYGEPQPTASGERFNPNALTAAHRRLPLGTIVRVTNLRNNRQTTVRINDRGPYIGGRILDLSRAAARELAMINSGVARVRVEVLPRSG